MSWVQGAPLVLADGVGAPAPCRAPQPAGSPVSRVLGTLYNNPCAVGCWASSMNPTQLGGAKVALELRALHSHSSALSSAPAVLSRARSAYLPRSDRFCVPTAPRLWHEQGSFSLFGPSPASPRSVSLIHKHWLETGPRHCFTLSTCESDPSPTLGLLLHARTWGCLGIRSLHALPALGQKWP